MDQTEAINLHNLQKRILFDLLFEKQLKYSELKPLEIENSQFVFHMKQLIEKGMVAKIQEGYALTDMGKEFANKINIENIGIYFQSKVTTVLCVTRGNDILIYKRLKNPFYGCFGFPTKKVIWGNDIKTTAIEGLKEETGLQGIPKLFSIKHYIVKNESGEVIEDKTMFGFSFENPKGILEGSTAGEYKWINKKEVENLKPTQPEFFEFLKDLNNFKSQINFEEITIKTDLF